MSPKPSGCAVYLDALGLFLAGLINTFLAPLVAGLVAWPRHHGPGTGAPAARRLDLPISTLRWQAGWLFWFAVTLSFSWSYYALARHLRAGASWAALAIGLALIAAAVDIVGVIVYLTVLPELAQTLAGSGSPVAPVFGAAERLAYGLTNVTAFGLYSAAGLLLLPAAWATRAYPRWLVLLGVVEWGIASLATLLLVIAPGLATVPLLVSFALYAPWVWASAVWLLRSDR